MLGTLTRAGAVLDLFSLDEPEWGVTAVAQRLGIGKSLAHDVLSSLASIGLLARVGHGRYRLGWRTVSLATVLLRTNELKAHARPIVRELVARQGLTVSLTAWDRMRIIYLDRHTRGGPAVPGPGTTVALDGHAAAQVLLAGRPPAEVELLWEQGLVHTRHDSALALLEDLEAIRASGWARSDPGPTATGGAVAAPVREADGAVAAAISIDLIGAGRTSAAELHVRAVTAAASRLSAAIRDPLTPPLGDRDAHATPMVPVA